LPQVVQKGIRFVVGPGAPAGSGERGALGFRRVGGEEC
jgi:hypothetical protein